MIASKDDTLLKIEVDRSKDSDDIVQKGVFDVYRNDLSTFQQGVDNLERGTTLLQQILKPTLIEIGVSLISVKISEKIRLKRLLYLDLSKTQSKLIKRSNKTWSALDRIVNGLEKRHDQAHKRSQKSALDLENSMKGLKKVNEKLKIVSKQLETSSKKETKNSGEIKRVQDLRKISEKREEHQRLILQKEKSSAQIKSLKAFTSTELSHSEYSFNMLKKLLPIRELVGANKEILLNRIDMLNKMIAAGTILKPLKDLSNDLGEVSLQFAEANAQMNNLMEEIQVIY